MGDEALLASQASLNNLSVSFGGRIPVRIFFLDNSSKVFLADVSTTSKDLVRLILEKFQVEDIERKLLYFGIFISEDGESIGRALSLDDSITDVVTQFPEESGTKLLFMIRLHTPSIMGLQYKDVVAKRMQRPISMLSNDVYFDSAEEIDPNLTLLQYSQAVYNIITGNYPTNSEQVLEFGALHFSNKFGDFDNSRHRPGFLGERIIEFIPAKQLKQKTMEQWEQMLFDTTRQYQQSNYGTGGVATAPCDERPQKVYVCKIFRLPLYGNTFFRAIQSSTDILPDKVILGIYHQGINVLDKKRTLMKQYRLEELSRWGYRVKEMFYFEVKLADRETGEEKQMLVEFNTPEGQDISDLLTDYAVAFMKEQEMVEERQHDKCSSVNSGGVFNGSREPFAKPSPPPPQLVQRSASPPVSTSAGSPIRPPSHRSQQSQATYNKPSSKQVSEISLFAVIKIQAIYRGYSCRQRVSQMIEDMFANGELE